MATESVTTTTSLSSIPSGTKIAVDTVDTDKLVQIVKCADGTDGVETTIKGAEAVPGASDMGWVVRQVGIPAAAALGDAMANPTIAQIAAYNLVWDGGLWRRMSSGISVPGSGDNGLVVRQVGLPAAAALADAVANPTLTQLAAYLALYNGTTWDRLRGTTSGLYAQGPVAHDGVMASNPIILGGYAATAFPSAVSAADVARLYVDEYGRTHVIAGGIPASVTGTITRETNTTAYTADDEVSSDDAAPVIVTLANCARVNGGGGRISAAFLTDSAYSATPGTFEAWLFDTTSTPNNDNVAWAPTDAVVKTCVTIIQFTLSTPGDKTAGTNGNRLYLGTIVYGNGEFKCAEGSTSLYWRMKVTNAYTPISAEAFDLKLLIDQD